MLERFAQQAAAALALGYGELGLCAQLGRADSFGELGGVRRQPQRFLDRTAIEQRRKNGERSARREVGRHALDHEKQIVMERLAVGELHAILRMAQLRSRQVSGAPSRELAHALVEL